MRFGMRASTDDQDTAAQVVALKAANCDQIVGRGRGFVDCSTDFGKVMPDPCFPGNDRNDSRYRR